MRVVVTGSEGFIGRRVVALLQERGHDVVRIDPLERQVHGLYQARDGVHPHRAGDPLIRPLLDGAEAIVHLGAQVGVTQSQYEPARYVDWNVLDTVKLWAMAREVPTLKKIVVASSMSIYGEGTYRAGNTDLLYGIRRDRPEPGHWDRMTLEQTQFCSTLEAMPVRTGEWKVPEPSSVYAQTKYDQERYTLLMGEIMGIPAVALRFFNTYGAGQALANPYTGALAQFACRVLNGKPPLVNEDGLQRRDFVHVSDVARAVVMSTEEPEVAGVFNVCTEQSATVLGLATMWCELAARRGLPKVEPLVRETYRVGDVRHCVGLYGALAKATGWHPLVMLEQGLEEVADWVQSLPEIPLDRSAEADAEAVAARVQR